MSDEYDGIFDDATMADFLRSTSAVTEVSRSNQGTEAFNQFVDEQLRAVRTAWIAAETYMQPLALIANHEKQRIFIPDDDETLGDFVSRLHREAVAMGAIWLFVAKRSMIANLGPDTGGDEPDVSDEAEWNKAVAAGIIRLGIMWYAERREGNIRQHRHGQMPDENGILGDMIEGSPSQQVPLFSTILGG